MKTEEQIKIYWDWVMYLEDTLSFNKCESRTAAHFMMSDLGYSHFTGFGRYISIDCPIDDPGLPDTYGIRERSQKENEF